GSDGRVGKPAHISEWLDRSSAQIEQRTHISLGSNLGFGFLGIEQFDIGTAPCPLLIAVLKFLETLFANGAMERALLLDFTGDLVLLNNLENELRRVTEDIEQPVTIFLAKHARQI